LEIITISDKKNKNPHDICTWKDTSECNECSIKGELQCHKDSKYTLWFMVGVLPSFIAAFGGMIFGYVFGPLNLIILILALSLYIGYLLFFFIIWEPRMLCSHCPYWAEGDAKIIHCYANEGIPKTVPYNPNPLSKSEQTQFVIGVILFVSIPLPILILGQQFIFLIISIIGIIMWFVILYHKICPDCLNFSCPFNRVPKKVIDSFLKLNPIMKDAWEKSGYKID